MTTKMRSVIVFEIQVRIIFFPLFKKNGPDGFLILLKLFSSQAFFSILSLPL